MMRGGGGGGGGRQGVGGLYYEYHCASPHT